MKIKCQIVFGRFNSNEFLVLKHLETLVAYIRCHISFPTLVEPHTSFFKSFVLLDDGFLPTCANYEVNAKAIILSITPLKMNFLMFQFENHAFQKKKFFSFRSYF